MIFWFVFLLPAVNINVNKMENQKNENSGKITSGAHLSCWLEIPPLEDLPLKGNAKTEVVVVGGGLAGLSAAYCLLKSGKKVVVVEDGKIGSGETGRTTAHLVTALDDRYYHLQSIFGKEQTRLIAGSHREAINMIERIISEEKINCDFTKIPGYLFLHPSDRVENLQRELEAAREAGLVVSMVGETPGINQLDHRQAIRFESQAQFHPMKYMHGLYHAIIKMGGEIYTNTHAKEINEKGITTDDNFRIEADHLVIATNSPINNKYSMHLTQYAYRTYVIGILVPKNSLPHALWWDTGDHGRNERIAPYHYIRTQPWTATEDLLLVGGEDHATGLADVENIAEEDRYRLLEEWTGKHIAKGETVYRWSGQVLEPMDGIAFIGRNPWGKNNIYIITGDSGNGMTHCTIGGMLISDLINGRENTLEDVYSPSRFKWRAVNTMFGEFMDGLIGYLRTKPDDADAVRIANIQPGDGSVVEIRDQKYGVYRDPDNKLHIVAAECTHLGCLVKWNNDEKSWDCPCHGSRFSYDGNVLNGPANVPLICYHEQAADFVAGIK